MSTPFPDTRRWWALALLCTAQFIVILDTSIFGVALPTIQTALGFSPEGLSWIFNGYVIAFGGLLLLGGRLTDLIGRRRVFMFGFLLLTVASVIAGFAETPGVLIAGRALQGIGAALIAPSALTIVMGLFAARPAELARALGFWGAAAAAGGTAGVFLGGVITEWLSWRWTFLVNVPLGLLVLGLSPAVLRHTAPRRGSVDIPGAVAITAAVVLAVYAIVTAEQAGWASTQTISLLTLSGLLLVGFFVIQSRRDQPLVPLHIFAAPNLSAANLVMGLLAAAWIPLWFFLNLYLQQVLRLSAFESGLALVPMTVAIMILMIGATGRLVGRFGFKPNLAAGLFALGGSLVLLARVPVDGSYLIDVLPASLLAALGMSLAYIPATIAGMSGARSEETGLASGLINTSYQIGSAFGLAAMVAVAAAYTPPGAGPSLPAMDLTKGFRAAFLSAAAVAGLGALITLIGLRQPRLRTAAPASAG